MPLLLSILLLCLPPIAIILAVGGMLTFIKRFRRGFGAHRDFLPGTIAAAIGLLLVHAGFFLAPLLLYADRVVTALCLVAPVSVVASIALLWVVMRTAGAENYKRISMIAYSLLGAYLLPVLVLAMNVR